MKKTDSIPASCKSSDTLKFNNRIILPVIAAIADTPNRTMALLLCTSVPLSTIIANATTFAKVRAWLVMKHPKDGL